MVIIYFIICMAASAAGAICGIGGGVIIKPVLDALGVMEVAAISFLSGCTVLSMTTYSVIKSKVSGKSQIEPKIGSLLALGAAVGGVGGKYLFSYLTAMQPDKERIGAIQAGCLLILTIGTLLYTVFKERIRTLRLNNGLACVLLGLGLGMISSFLGIGGGPINLVLLYFCFSMTTKEAAENSLYIIFFSQIASLGTSLITGSVPVFNWMVLAVMAAGGIVGGICGRYWNKKIDEKTVEKLFIGLMIVIILININNIFAYW